MLLLQITDTHLYQDKQRTLLGVNTFSSFSETIALVERSQWDLDLILATGDLVHDASENGYQALAQTLTSFSVPVYCLPGNHDKPSVMQQHLNADNVSCPLFVDQKGWRLILLDSVLAGSEGGHFTEQEIQRLEKALIDAPEHVLISMHHQPVAVGSRWLDTMQVDNAEEFWKVVDRHLDKVRCVLWGHIHQKFEDKRGDIHLIGSPSTCVQFTPEQDDFGVDAIPPGLRLINLGDDGSVSTEVVRLDNLPEGLDAESAGY